MAWTYREITSEDVNEVLAGMLSTLNSLTPEESSTAKTAADNQFHGAARGLVVWWSGPRPSISPFPNHAEWLRVTVTTDHDYASLYQQLTNALNIMRFPDAYYAGISFTNAAQGDATLSWYYRMSDPPPFHPPINPIGD